MNAVLGPKQFACDLAEQSCALKAVVCDLAEQSWALKEVLRTQCWVRNSLHVTYS